MKLRLMNTTDVGNVTAALLNSGYSVSVTPVKKHTEYEHWIEYELEYKEMKV